jgi:hypothetical protein
MRIYRRALWWSSFRFQIPCRQSILSCRWTLGRFTMSR